MVRAVVLRIVVNRSVENFVTEMVSSQLLFVTDTTMLLRQL